ncbi:hypothetical protein WA026_006211 [Henosepilachna vigintioctopunctata]|uniref:Asparagine synthetase domain-containing protein n=1 Tax=Henosepilachna vigintioctopunctata TaxID=420089 RepID=A0AAW1TN73_9CUCU
MILSRYGDVCQKRYQKLTDCDDGPTSKSHILLAGIGADELFGGYTRYRSAFEHDGRLSLHNFLRKDWEYLPYRNLGRDGRVASDHDRQLSTPYLGEELVNCFSELKLLVKDVPQENIGTKLLLRALALNFELTKAAVEEESFKFGF